MMNDAAEILEVIGMKDVEAFDNGSFPGMAIHEMGTARMSYDPKAFFKTSELLGKPDHDPEQWIADMKAIASEKNVVCKISGVVTHAPGYPLTADNLAPAINHCLDIFGSDRVMFASDWPVCLIRMDMRSWVNILKKVVVNRSYKDQKKLFYDNAVKFYKI